VTDATGGDPPGAIEQDAGARGPDGARTAIVTGGASGIGLAIAERLAHDGLAVAVFDRDAGAADEAAAKITADGGTAIGVTVDVTEREAIDAGVERARAELGPPTVLVNNAGIDGFAPFLKLTAEAWNRVLEVNLTGTFHCCQAVVPHMIDAGWGRIVNISSSSAQGGQPFMTHYVASKAGMIGLTKALALELGPKGITVNTIPPGFIDTPMLRRTEEKGRLGNSVDHHASQTPVRRVGWPEDIAAMCSFLVREEASYVTGQVLGVNGGRNT
jgi:2-hydroxycyclohexanecarboxyl-CoA dehydrogenase